MVRRPLTGDKYLSLTTGRTIYVHGVVLSRVYYEDVEFNIAAFIINMLLQ